MCDDSAWLVTVPHEEHMHDFTERMIVICISICRREQCLVYITISASVGGNYLFVF